MKNMRFLLTACLLFLITLSYSQTSETLLSEVPDSPEGFDSTSEKQAIATINWLEKTPLDQNAKKRQQQTALLVQWITKSPTVSIELNASTLTFMKKNPELLIFFMGGWTKYCLQHNHSNDKVKCTMAGLKSAIKIYKKGVEIKKDKNMEKLIALQDKGELEDWVKKQLE
jgi:hypothetical protein